MRSRDRKAAGWALFLDFDGTLVDIAPSPGSIRTPEDLPALLERVSVAVGGAMAIVTGRSVGDIDSYLNPLHVVVAGGHGAEIRVGPNELVCAASPISPSMVDAVRALSTRFEGTSVEIKRSSIAVHYRSNPGAGGALEGELRRLLSEKYDDFSVCMGRKVCELVPSHVCKGAAIKALLTLPQFQGRRPIVIGDDLSDESAFAIAESLGGVALKVAGEHFSPEAADFREPSEVRDWLASFAAGLGA